MRGRETGTYTTCCCVPGTTYRGCGGGGTGVPAVTAGYTGRERGIGRGYGGVRRESARSPSASRTSSSMSPPSKAFAMRLARESESCKSRQRRASRPPPFARASMSRTDAHRLRSRKNALTASSVSPGAVCVERERERDSSLFMARWYSLSRSAQCAFTSLTGLCGSAYSTTNGQRRPKTLAALRRESSSAGDQRSSYRRTPARNFCSLSPPSLQASDLYLLSFTYYNILYCIYK